MSFELPDQGLVFWPVANGDSTTVAVDQHTTVQIDLNHLEASEDSDEPTWAVVDELVEGLRRRSGKPFLAAFALTHPDQDHCRGFERLVDQVTIGELWFTPRIFREYRKELCDDARAFRDEAKRRVALTIKAGGDPGEGNRVRLFGASDWLGEDEYHGFPEGRLIIPGDSFKTINDEDFAGVFRGFVHGPFKEDCDDAERNDTSLALQITLTSGDARLKALLFGDLTYAVLKKIFDRSDDDDIEWNVLLSPHHCSKSAMFWKATDEEEEKRRQDILDAISKVVLSPSFVIASSRPVPARDTKGADPPHAKAKKCYEEITETFLCTMETPSEEEPAPIVFDLTDDGPALRGKIPPAPTASEAADKAQGGDAPPKEPTTYGDGHARRPRARP